MKQEKWTEAKFQKVLNAVVSLYPEGNRESGSF